MQYMGGKHRVARPIAEAILAAKMPGHTLYVEPFLGAASVFSLVAPHFPRAIGADLSPDLIYLWRACLDGWSPPLDLSEAEYQRLRHEGPSALRAVAGFGCSFGGKWWGGYARDRRKRCSFAETFARGIAKRLPGMVGADLHCCDYRALTEEIGPQAIVYADPPYAGTTEYGAARGFNSDDFWATMGEWADRGAVVFVSEYAGRDGWDEAWASEQPASLAGGTAGRVTERLYMRAA